MWRLSSHHREKPSVRRLLTSMVDRKRTKVGSSNRVITNEPIQNNPTMTIAGHRRSRFIVWDEGLSGRVVVVANSTSLVIGLLQPFETSGEMVVNSLTGMIHLPPGYLHRHAEDMRMLDLLPMSADPCECLRSPTAPIPARPV